MSVADFPAEEISWVLPVAELIGDDDLKRLPPLFYDETNDIENLLLVHKLVSESNPAVEVYLYEHEDGVFSAMLVERKADTMLFSLHFLRMAVSDSLSRFVHIVAFKPRSIGELFNEAEAHGQTVVAEERVMLTVTASEGEAS